MVAENLEPWKTLLLYGCIKGNETGLWAAIVRASELLPQGVSILSAYNNKINQSSMLLSLINEVHFCYNFSIFLKDRQTNKTGVPPFFEYVLQYIQQIRLSFSFSRNRTSKSQMMANYQESHLELRFHFFWPSPFIPAWQWQMLPDILSIFLFVRQLWLAAHSSLIWFIAVLTISTDWCSACAGWLCEIPCILAIVMSSSLNSFFCFH